MTTYDNTNRGILFDNDRKTTPTQADMKGSLNIDGTDYWFDAWWKTGAKGEFLSLSLGGVKVPRQPDQPAETPVRRGNRPSNAAQVKPADKVASGFDDMDDDIPF